MIQAGSMGVPFVPIRGLAGTDVFKRRDDMMIVANPFDADEDIVIARAENPDVAILHGLKADREGNAILRRHGEDLVVAQASRKVILTVEEIVDKVSPDDPDGTYISTINVTAVSHAPFGAHPTGCPPHYEIDKRQIKEYLECSGNDEAFQAYLDKYVHSHKTHEEYLERFGVASAAPR